MEHIKIVEKLAEWCRRYADLGENTVEASKRRWIAMVLNQIVTKSKRELIRKD